MLDHMLESSYRDDSNKWSNIGFGEESNKKSRLKLMIHLLARALTILNPLNAKLFFYYLLFVPRKVLWCALRSLGVEEWAVRVIQGMYTNVRSRVRVNGQ